MHPWRVTSRKSLSKATPPFLPTRITICGWAAYSHSRAELKEKRAMRQRSQWTQNDWHRGTFQSVSMLHITCYRHILPESSPQTPQIYIIILHNVILELAREREVAVQPSAGVGTGGLTVDNIIG